MENLPLCGLLFLDPFDLALPLSLRKLFLGGQGYISSPLTSLTYGNVGHAVQYCSAM